MSCEYGYRTELIISRLEASSIIIPSLEAGIVQRDEGKKGYEASTVQVLAGLILQPQGYGWTRENHHNTLRVEASEAPLREPKIVCW